MHPFNEHMNPYLGKMLENIKLDKTFVKGQGCYLYDKEGKEYLDCIASYGALPFGHNDKAIWKCILDFYESKEPSFVQPSTLNAAGELAKRLIEVAPTGLKYVTFTNSGAETVEAAFKLCRSATNRLGILSTKNSFHGKTLGALSATGKDSYQMAFGAPVEGFSFIDYGNLNALEDKLNNNPDYYAAFIVEPIQGEGGIVEPPAGYLKEAKKLCERYGVIFIIDEIQTGLGRTGNLFACEYEDVSPDVLLLSKALGGGIVPIGACICTKEVYNEDFGLKHSSTFAGNSFACRIGLKVLDLLLSNNRNILNQIKENGMLFKDRLMLLKDKYPNIIKSIRGRGLMLGIEFGVDRDTFPGSLISVMAEQELLTPIISSYLLNVEGIRVAPTLNGNNVIRIEPPLIITKEQCIRALNGIEKMLDVLSTGNTARFLSYIIGINDNREYRETVNTVNEKIIPLVDNLEGRFAFLVHPVDLKNYTQFDESLYSFNENELTLLTDAWNDLVEPFVISQTKVTSKSGKKAYGEFIAIPKTSQQFLNMPRKQAIYEINKAVNLAKNRGAKIVGLGAYTSVVTGGGLFLKDNGVAITSGNSYTVVAAVDAVTSALEKLETLPENSVAAIVGASGSIGRGVSILISEKVSKLILIGNSNNKISSYERLYKISGEIYKYIATLINQNTEFKLNSIGYKISNIKELPKWNSPIDEFVKFAKSLSSQNSPIIISTSIDEMLPMADIVISATSSPEKIITSENLKYCAIVCEMSRPSNVKEDVDICRPDVLVIDGGVIEVPGLPSLGWDFGFDKGHAYACMSETMMLALEQRYENMSIGSTGVTLESILFTKSLADKHGFKLADFKSFNKPVSSEKWECILRHASSIKLEAN